MGVYLGTSSKYPNADTLTITPEILAAIAGIDEFKGAWRALIGDIQPLRHRLARNLWSFIL